MGQTARTTKLLLDLSGRDHGGTNPGKRAHLAATVEILNAARRFYLDFFLAHPDKLSERVEIISKKTGEVREGVISAENLLSLSLNFRPLPPVRIPILCQTGILARAFLIFRTVIAAPSSRT